MRAAAALALALALAACARVDYDRAPVGRFSGTLFVMWVGEGEGLLGDGRFLFVPDPGDPLTFTSARGGPAIAPGMFYTDGGSIPKPAQLFNGFSPWGYAPAYMIHDWLFIAHHCHSDSTPAPEHQALAGMSFQRSAELIAETIRTLIAEGRVRPNDVAPAVITATVAGPFSRYLWDRRGACADHGVDPEHAAAARAAIPGQRSSLRLRRDDGSLVTIRPATVVSQVRF